MKRAALFYWMMGIALAAIAIGVAFYFDEPVRQWMVAHQTPGTHAFMQNVSRFGDWPEHMLLGLILIAAAQLRGDKKWTRILLAMLIALSIAGLSGRVLKISTARARPSVKSEQVWWNAQHWNSKYHSFPSGHVDASVGFFGVLFLARRRAGLICLPIPVLIAFSRLYLSAHWLSDVVCAALLGILSAIIVWRFLGRRIGLGHIEGSNKPAILPNSGG